MKQPKSKPVVQIPYLPGTNCERETMAAFQLAGARPKLVLLDDIESKRVKPQDCDLVAVVGGFSYGDWIRCGAIGALMLQEYLQEQREAGKPMIGICNGFQILVEAGIFGPGVALVQNDCKRFQSVPVLHRVIPTNCLWTVYLDGKVLQYPAAHGFGKVVYNVQLARFKVVIVYESESPNGGYIAAIATEDGLVLGGMDHPERPYGNPEGMLIIQNGVNAVR